MNRLAACVCLLAACAPSSEVLMSVDTDAPVPALFDRLRIDVSAPDGTLRETREISVTDEMFRARQVSFGVAAPVGESGWSVRLRLYRGPGSEPRRTSTIDGVVSLPPLDRTSVRPLSVFLETESIGIEQQPLESAPAAASSRVGSWDGAAPQPCSGSARAEEACVPGGAFLFGDTQINGLLPQLDTPSERLVVVDPFFIDVREVTVADFRRQMSKFSPSPLLDPVPQVKPFDPRQLNSWCLWTDAPGPNEQLPINCIGRQLARRYCRSLGKDLPSEAQLEFLASGRGRENVYVWGHDEPTCGDAVWGLAGGGGAASALLAVSYDGTCLPASSAGGAAAPGHGARDRLTLPDPGGGSAREVLDLAGNLAEWASDTWSRASEPFWSGAGVLRNPVANLQSIDDQRETSRGGYWYGSPLALRAGSRVPMLTDSYSNGLGFRCARPAR